jgi:hypothetical protein
MAKSKSIVAPGLDQVRALVTEDELKEAGVDLAADFPGSTAADFLQYPVLSEGGWFIAIKHQPTLQSVSRRPWRLFGPVSLLSENLGFE